MRANDNDQAFNYMWSKGSTIKCLTYILFSVRLNIINLKRFSFLMASQ